MLEYDVRCFSLLSSWMPFQLVMVISLKHLFLYIHFKTTSYATEHSEEGMVVERWVAHSFSFSWSCSTYLSSWEEERKEADRCESPTCLPCTAYDAGMFFSPSWLYFPPNSSHCEKVAKACRSVKGGIVEEAEDEITLAFPPLHSKRRCFIGVMGLGR